MNDQDDYPHARNQPFTLRKSGERALLEFWHIGYGPDISYGLCVADPNLDRLWGRYSASAAACQPTLPMSNKLRVSLSEPIAAEVIRISAILGLSPDKTAQYLIKCCLKLYYDTGGDTMGLIGLAEGIYFPTREQAQAVAERLEAEAALNHLEDPEQEKLISVEVLEKGDGWKFKIDHLCGGTWKDIDALEREPPPFQ